MSEQGKSTYTNFWVYQVDPAWRKLDKSEQDAARDAFVALLDEAPGKGVKIRGVYSTVGLRPDSDLILWGISDDFDALQCFSIAVRDSTLGNYLTLRMPIQACRWAPSTAATMLQHSSTVLRQSATCQCIRS